MLESGMVFDIRWFCDGNHLQVQTLRTEGQIRLIGRSGVGRCATDQQAMAG
jgi:hypothetical protein